MNLLQIDICSPKQGVPIQRFSIVSETTFLRTDGSEVVQTSGRIHANFPFARIKGRGIGRSHLKWIACAQRIWASSIPELERVGKLATQIAVTLWGRDVSGVWIVCGVEIKPIRRIGAWIGIAKVRGDLPGLLCQYFRRFDYR